MSLKRPFVPKSDVKQGFTTTTTMSDIAKTLMLHATLNQESASILSTYFQFIVLSCTHGGHL